MKQAIVPLADGFEEIEAVAIIDVLRRAKIAVTVAGVGGVSIVGSHGIRIECDGALESCDLSTADAVVLPGGLPGTTNLARDATVRRVLEQMAGESKLIGAICAAPKVLNDVGLLEGRAATSHPNNETEMDRCVYRADRVVVDGNVITSRGAGTAIEFAAELVRYLAGEDVAEDVLNKIVYTT